jgi:hypothetical protein
MAQKESHAQGYRSAIYSLSAIRAFSGIKDATVQATLQSMSTASQGAAKSSMKIMEGTGHC